MPTPWPQRTEPHQRYCTTIDITHIYTCPRLREGGSPFFPPTYIVEILCSLRFVAAMASRCDRTPRRPSPRPIRLCELPRPGFNFFQGPLLTYGFYNLLDFRIFPSAPAQDKEACMPRRDESTFRAHWLEGSQDAGHSGGERRHFEGLSPQASQRRLGVSLKIADG